MGPCQAPVSFWGTCLNLWVSKGIITHFCFHWFTYQAMCSHETKLCCYRSQNSWNCFHVHQQSHVWIFSPLVSFMNWGFSFWFWEDHHLWPLSALCSSVQLCPDSSDPSPMLPLSLCSRPTLLGELWKSILSLSCLFHFFALLLHLI